MIIKNDTAYADKDYQIKDVICTSKWLDTIGDKTFPLPKLDLEIGDKQAISTDDMFTFVSLIGEAKNIKSGPKPNTDAYIDFDSQTITFLANKNIKESEEITYTLHPSCFNNVKIR